MDTNYLTGIAAGMGALAAKRMEKVALDAFEKGTVVNYEDAIQRLIDKAVKAAVKDAVAWLAGENQELRDQVADLEIEIEIERNSFTDVGDGDIFPKQRGIWRNEN